MAPRSKLLSATVLVVLFACTGATWVASPGKGSHEGTFTPTVSLVTVNQQNLAATALTIAHPTSVNVTAGDLVVFIFGGHQTVDSDFTVASSPSIGTFTEIYDLFDGVPNNFGFGVYACVATSTQTGVTVTGTLNLSDDFRFALVAVFRTTSGTFSIGQATANSVTPGTQAASSTNRTAQNLTTTLANSLLVAVGIDWNGTTHTAANGYSLGVDGTVPWMYWKQISAIATVPNGNFGTVSPADNYYSFFLEFPLNP